MIFLIPYQQALHVGGRSINEKVYMYIFLINEIIQVEGKKSKKGNPTVFTAATLSKHILPLSEDSFEPGRKKPLYESSIF